MISNPGRASVGVGQIIGRASDRCEQTLKYHNDEERFRFEPILFPVFVLAFLLGLSLDKAKFCLQPSGQIIYILIRRKLSRTLLCPFGHRSQRPPPVLVRFTRSIFRQRLCTHGGTLDHIRFVLVKEVFGIEVGIRRSRFFEVCVLNNKPS